MKEEEQQAAFEEYGQTRLFLKQLLPNSCGSSRSSSASAKWCTCTPRSWCARSVTHPLLPLSSSTCSTRVFKYPNSCRSASGARQLQCTPHPVSPAPAAAAAGRRIRGHQICEHGVQQLRPRLARGSAALCAALCPGRHRRAHGGAAGVRGLGFRV